MDWVILFLLLGVLAYLVVISRQLDDVKRRQRQTLQSLNQFRTRQTSVAQGRVIQRGPTIDAQARTIRRDSNDIPATGRMSRAIHRTKVDYARTDTDD